MLKKERFFVGIQHAGELFSTEIGFVQIDENGFFDFATSPIMASGKVIKNLSIFEKVEYLDFLSNQFGDVIIKEAFQTDNNVMITNPILE